MYCLWIRSLFFLGLWLVVSGFTAYDLAIGAPTAFGAAWASVRLLPCASVRLNFLACLEIGMRLPVQIAKSGIEIAIRALHSDLQLRPGFIRYRSRLPYGVSRSAFTVLISMQPGSVPVAGHRSGDLVIHCLGDTLPVADAVEADEARLSKALGLGGASG